MDEARRRLDDFAADQQEARHPDAWALQGLMEVRMGVVQLPDELQRAIERQVAQGRAASAEAFLENAVMRLIDETHAEEDAVRQSVEAGLADIEAGRHTTVATQDDGQRLLDRLQARLATDG